MLQVRYLATGKAARGGIRHLDGTGSGWVQQPLVTGVLTMAELVAVAMV
jgi:hypothetical protein